MIGKVIDGGSTGKRVLLDSGVVKRGERLGIRASRIVRTPTGAA